MQEAHGGRLIGRRRFIQLGAAAGMTMFALGVTGCSPLPATSSAKSSYVPGAYTAQAQGKQSLVTVEVTFGENAIEAVEVLGHYESERIANTAISAITSDIVELQSLDVDAVTGATLTSPWPSSLRSETASGKLAAAFPIWRRSGARKIGRRRG